MTDEQVKAFLVDKYLKEANKPGLFEELGILLKKKTAKRKTITIPKTRAPGLTKALDDVQALAQKIHEATFKIQKLCTHAHRDLTVETYYSEDEWSRSSQNGYYLNCKVCGKQLSNGIRYNYGNLE